MKTTVKDIKRGKPQLFETYIILDEIRNYMNQQSKDFEGCLNNYKSQDQSKLKLDYQNITKSFDSDQLQFDKSKDMNGMFRNNTKESSFIDNNDSKEIENEKTN